MSILVIKNNKLNQEHERCTKNHKQVIVEYRHGTNTINKIYF